VVILHHDLPNLTKEDLAIYLDVLQESTLSWKPGEDHRLIVAFPKELESAVLGVLHDLEKGKE
jgi:hypothetical protein